MAFLNQILLKVSIVQFSIIVSFTAGLSCSDKEAAEILTIYKDSLSGSNISNANEIQLKNSSMVSHSEAKTAFDLLKEQEMILSLPKALH